MMTQFTDEKLFHQSLTSNCLRNIDTCPNDFFIKAASDIGNEEPIRDDETIDDILCTYDGCEVIQRITSNVPHDGIFKFSSTSVKEVNDLLNKTDPTKATGYDDIPPKLLKLGATELAPTITNLINRSIEKCRFPTALKKSELSPLYKNKDNLITGNYRPLSILPSLSKIFEKIFNKQLYDYFKHILSGLLSAFRKKYGCHHVLTRLIEDCKKALDEHMHVGLLLLDLSKAFDCLPHKLLLCKLHAVSRDACDLLCSYLTNPTQRVKISTVKSDWAKLIKGVPQGSVFRVPTPFGWWNSWTFPGLFQDLILFFKDPPGLKQQLTRINILSQVSLLLHKQGKQWFNGTYQEILMNNISEICVNNIQVSH